VRFYWNIVLKLVYVITKVVRSEVPSDNFYLDLATDC